MGFCRNMVRCTLKFGPFTVFQALARCVTDAKVGVQILRLNAVLPES